MIIARNSMTTGLVRAIDENPSVALLGPHQVGKTALARELARHRPGTVYLDLERLADQRKLEDAGAFLQA
jgi:predicted AAA+ superfamily ATPase